MEPVSSTQENKTGQTLAANSYQEVIVTINYASNGARADGPFSVRLGDVYLTYSTINDFEFVPNGTYACTLTTETEHTQESTTSPIITITSEVVTCGSEQFYVMERTSSTITMLAKYNLSTSASPYLQDTTGAINPVWYSETSSEYGEGTIIYPYVEAYEGYLKNTLGIITADATLLSLNQAQTLLGFTKNDYDVYMASSSTPSWAYSTKYWLKEEPWAVGANGSRQLYSAQSYWSDEWGISDPSDPSNNVSAYGGIGIRPVVTISASLVQK